MGLFPKVTQLCLLFQAEFKYIKLGLWNKSNILTNHNSCKQHNKVVKIPSKYL